MYRILVADDEVHICQLIRHLVDWDRLDAQLCGMANNGVEALELIRTEHPQVVISDIRMSGMDGISLLEQVRSAGIHCAFILVSGYREFEYAQRAIHLDVTDYLVKPINKQALNQAIERAIARLDGAASPEQGVRRERAEQETGHSLQKLRLLVETNSAALGQASLAELGEQQGISHPERLRLYYWKVVSSEPFRKETLPQLQESVAAALGREPWAGGSCCAGWEQGGLLFADAGEAPPELSALQRSCQKAISAFAHWRVIFAECAPLEREPLRTTLCRARRAAQSHYFNPSETCFRAEEDGQTLRLEDVGEQLKLPALMDSMKLLDARSVTGQIRQNFRVLEEKGSAGLLFAYAGWVADAMNHALSSFAATQAGLEEIPYLHRGELLEQLFHCLSLVTCCARLCETLETCISSMREHIEQLENRPVRMVRDLVASRYMEHLNLNDIAETVDLNPVYLSALFKKETGINFKDYLTNVRMDKAKELLRQGESINAVSEKVGYQDTKYFSKLFARSVGVNPTQYKKLYR